MKKSIRLPEGNLSDLIRKRPAKFTSAAGRGSLILFLGLYLAVIGINRPWFAGLMDVWAADKSASNKDKNNETADEDGDKSADEGGDQAASEGEDKSADEGGEQAESEGEDKSADEGGEQAESEGEDKGGDEGGDKSGDGDQDEGKDDGKEDGGGESDKDEE